jgi:hypothetical protein
MKNELNFTLIFYISSLLPVESFTLDQSKKLFYAKTVFSYSTVSCLYDWFS